MYELNQQLIERIAEDVSHALAEDIGSGDLTAELVPVEQQARASLRVRDDAVICGAPWFDEVFRQLTRKIEIEWLVVEGDIVKADTIICNLAGPARQLLTGERTALNFLQTLSATATAARAFSMAISNTDAVILDTRKTLPGLRMAQKYAVRTGGGENHRMGLYDVVLIKENHIFSCGGITAAIEVALAKNPTAPIVVEVENTDEAREAILAGANQLLLDNFDPSDMVEAVALRNQLNADIKLEASGGVNLESVQEIAATGIDYISVGTLTKDIRAIDLSMRFDLD